MSTINCTTTDPNIQKDKTALSTMILGKKSKFFADELNKEGIVLHSRDD